MADCINCVTISGNLTRDADTSRVGGRNLIKFGMAVNDRRKNQHTGEWEDYANFIDVAQFMTDGQMEAFFHGYDKGAKAVVHGKLRYSSWESKDGGKRSKLEVVADAVEVVGRSKGAGSGTYQQPTAHPEQQAFNAAAPAPAAPAAAVYDESIPF